MQCGLCCDGTFYGSVAIGDDESERLGRVGLRVLRAPEDRGDGALTMAQPCSALRGVLCTVYADRPSACARFECTLRKNVRAGESTLDEGVANVAGMRALLATIRGGLDCPDTTSIWEKILELEEPAGADAAAAARDYAAVIAAVGELLNVGRAVFEPRFAGGGTR
jgi:Fe-S-cluster containining protein